MSNSTLAEVIKPATARRAGEETDLPLLSMTMHDGLVDQSMRFKKRIASDDTSQYKIVERGQLVVGFPIDEGVLDFQLLHDRAIVSPAYGIWDVVRDDVDPAYLRYFLRSERALSFYRSKLRSTTARRRSLPAETFLSLSLRLPSLDEQRRIAAILDRVEEQRTAASAALGWVGTATAASFRGLSSQVETRRPLGEIATFYGGSSLPRGVAWAGQPDGYLLMKVSDMNTPGNEVRIATTATWSSQPGSRASTVPAGAVVLPKRGASIATNKKRALTRSTVLDPNLMGVLPDPRTLTTEYLFAWFREFDLSSITSGSSVPQLNKQDLSPLLIPVPPLAAQRAFGEIVAESEKLRASMARRLAMVDSLASQLSARAFRGEL